VISNFFKTLKKHFSFEIQMLKPFRGRIILEHIKAYYCANFGEEIRGLRVKKIIFPKIVKFEVFQ
jgi:hypothetical protein